MINIFNWKWLKKKNDKVKPEHSGKCEVVSAIGTEDGRIKIELDWDSNFIEYLRQAGYTGSEEQIIQKYLVEQNRQVLGDMGELNNDFH